MGATTGSHPRRFITSSTTTSSTTPPGFIEAVFRNTVAIVKSRWHPTRERHYSSFGKLYPTVVVDSEDRRIKTASISDAIKGGEVKWGSPRFMN